MHFLFLISLRYWSLYSFSDKNYTISDLVLLLSALSLCYVAQNNHPLESGLLDYHNIHVSFFPLNFRLQLIVYVTFFSCSIPVNMYFGNSEYPDEMSQKMAFHQGMHCLLSYFRPSGTEMYLNLGI